MTDWIACSERMPTEQDGDVEGCVNWLLLHRNGGLREIARTSWDCRFLNRGVDPTHWRPTGITSLPEPEKPKRREWRLIWCSRDGGAAQGWNVFDMDLDASLLITYQTNVRVREVLPDDPDIDACRELLDWLKTHQNGCEFGLGPSRRQTLTDLINKC